MQIDVSGYRAFLKAWRCFLGLHHGGINTGFIALPPFYRASYKATCSECGQTYWRSRP